MEVIINAGDGRADIESALASCADFDFKAAETHLTNAEAKILKAHNAQTETIQAQAAGEDVEYSLLFTHAQDTLMTVSAELHLARRMLPVFRALASKSA